MFFSRPSFYNIVFFRLYLKKTYAGRLLVFLSCRKSNNLLRCVIMEPRVFIKYMKLLTASFVAAFVVLTVCLGAATSAQDFDGLHSAGNGIDIDTHGRILPLSKEKSEALGKMMEELLEPLPESLDKKVTRRTISLKKLDTQVENIVEQFEVLPDSIRYLGGLTSIDYIVLVPEKNDILLVGPAEGWRSDAAGNVVGSQSGLPVLLFEDFLTALRLWNQSAVRSLVCTIEPTPETQAALARLHRQFTSITADNADAYSAALEEAYGDVPIKLTGVPESSRTARILVAADLKMKRIAFGLESSQIRNIPSYVGLISTNRPGNPPQFWLTSEYTATAHDSRKLTWRLGDVKIRVSSRATGGIDRAALTWCRSLEENYDALVRAQPVFGELRNTMTLSLAAALIHQENLLQRTNCTLPFLLDESNLKLLAHPVPRSVEYRSVKSRNGFLTIVACGGVEISPLAALRNNMRLDSRIDSERTKLLQVSGEEWWSQ